MNLIILFCFFISPALKASDYSKSNLKISIIIPCSYKHAQLLHPLLKLYAQQTVLPYEVIISLSEASKAPGEYIRQIEYGRWPFHIKLLFSEFKHYAGTNRNIACSRATGDIFICQDADDIPHPQRVEIIKYFFEHYDIDHLLHLFTLSKNSAPLPFLDPQTIELAHETKYEKARTYNPKIHNGCSAITREVFDRIQWPDTAHHEDGIFNYKVYQNFKNCMILRASLYIYRNELSSWANNVASSSSCYGEKIYQEFYRNYPTLKPKSRTISNK